MAHNTIDGNPTKKFFIEMITRDISIEDAIIDLFKFRKFLTCLF